MLWGVGGLCNPDLAALLATRSPASSHSYTISTFKRQEPQMPRKQNEYNHHQIHINEVGLEYLFMLNPDDVAGQRLAEYTTYIMRGHLVGEPIKGHSRVLVRLSKWEHHFAERVDDYEEIKHIIAVGSITIQAGQLEIWLSVPRRSMAILGPFFSQRRPLDLEITATSVKYRKAKILSFGFQTDRLINHSIDDDEL